MRIAVLFGGDSSERDVSIASAAQVVPALRSSGHEVFLVDTARGAIAAGEERRVLDAEVGVAPPTSSELASLPTMDASLRLPAEVASADLVFLALHGGAGENGQLQSLFELAGIPYTGSGPVGSALAMDKEVSKRLFRAAGIRTPDWCVSPAADQDIEALGLPLIVKPNAQGSTVGLTLVRSRDGIADATAAAAHFGTALYEQYVPGREITVGVLDGEPLAVGEILLGGADTFSYAQKYQAGAVSEVFPADLPEAVTEEARVLALAAHHCLKLDGYSRSDFRLDAAGRLWLIEVNTLPGLTATSLLPQSAGAAGIDYVSLCERICALARHA
jgi:D-alanine-D-alanine ligase